ncbi:MAG TPA: UDP-N-acetylmuramoyl-tripeptide--D-alanyl-D-alanine ligase [Verrucomicrobiae bacterium]
MADACGGQLHAGAPDAPVRRVCTDSRAVQAGDLFVAIKGERFDGHDFLPEAAKQGAAALVMGFSRAAAIPPGCGVVLVDDPRRALGQLAARYRRDFDLPVIAVAGSNGKTSTKELLAGLLAQNVPTLSSEASFNNDIGVPLTLLRLDKVHRAAVLEIGTNHPGELAPLIEMVQPRFGIIASIGREHLEFFGDLAGVAREEGTLAEMLPADGKLFVNGDSPMISEIARRSRAPVVHVGFHAGNEWRVWDLHLDAKGTRFTIESPSHAFDGEYRMKLLGSHQVTNAMLAIAVAAELGLSREQIATGLAAAQPAKMRLQLRAAPGGFHVLDDTYNANADSMLAALETLRDLPCTTRRVAVLGDMAELGEQSGPAHADVGRHVALAGVGRLFLIGRHAAVTAAAAREAGLDAVEILSDVDAALPAICAAVEPGDVVLVKASRAARLERVVEALMNAGVKA